MVKNKPIYVCKHHEMAFYYWCKAMKDMSINTFFLVTIDRHKDLLGLLLNVKKEIKKLDLNELDNIRELAACPRQQNKLAYNQFYAAMEAGLVQDMLLISPEVPCAFIYQDLSKLEHKIFHCKHPKNLKDLLTIDNTLKKSIGYPKGEQNIILDIDLDFFTYPNDQEEVHVISEEDFKNIFSNDSLIWWIYEKARLMTISKETYWCGGIDNSERIFKYLKTYFLNRINN